MSDHEMEDSFNDPDSFNQPDDVGNLSDDSFNGNLSDDSFNDGDDVGQDGMDEAEFGVEASAAAAASSSSSSSAAAVPSVAYQLWGKPGEYVVEGENDLRRSMLGLTREVASLLDVPMHLASMLLRTHSWDKEKFVSEYFEDPDRLLTKVGLQYMAEDGRERRLQGPAKDELQVRRPSLPLSTVITRAHTEPQQATAAAAAASDMSQSTSENVVQAVSSSSTNLTSTSTFNCSICYDDFALQDTLALGCAHRFCLNCWGHYLETAVSDGRLCIVTRCAGFKCPVLVSDAAFKELTTPDVYHRHQMFLLRSYVEDNRLMRWCPAQRCSYAVRALNSSLSAVKCRCGYAFCFKCGEESHAPVSCDQLSAWLEKCKNESETAHWIIANCFPANDHQLLTRHGFMYLHDVLSHFDRHAKLSVACIVGERLEYHDITRSDVTIHTGTHQHVKMESRVQGGRLGADVSLCPTDNHRMWVRLPKTESAGLIDEPLKDATVPYLNRSAADVLAAGVADASAMAQFTGMCEAGAVPVDQSGLLLTHGLGLTTVDACDAFLELYGYWLRVGSFERRARAIAFHVNGPSEYSSVDSLVARINASATSPHLSMRSTACAVPVQPIEPPVDHVQGSAAHSQSYLLHSPQWCQYFAQCAIQHGSNEATLPNQLLAGMLDGLNKRQLRLILRGAQASDTNSPMNGSVYASSSRLRDELLQLCLHAGYSANFIDHATQSTSDPSHPQCRLSSSPRHRWEVCYTSSAIIAEPMLNIAKECNAESRDGTVWCVTVPTNEHLIMVRRVLETERAAALHNEGGSGREIITRASRPIVVGNTKRCPKCSIRIEKNQGCNHMTCRGCKFEWCWVCVAEGSAVSLPTGVSAPIEELLHLPSVMTYVPGAGVEKSASTGWKSNGVRECIELLFNDGRTLICTPDHRIMQVDGTWSEADHLVIGESCVAASVDYPMVRRDEDKANADMWKLNIMLQIDEAVDSPGEELQLDMQTSRDKSMAFARLLGYVLSGNSDPPLRQCYGSDLQLLLARALDVAAIQADIAMLTDRRSSHMHAASNHSVTLPHGLCQAILFCVSEASFSSAKQVSSLPPFILLPTCPLTLVREFIAALFGGGASVDALNDEKRCRFSSIAFMTQCMGSVVRAQMEQLRAELEPLLARLGIASDRCTWSICLSNQGTAARQSPIPHADIDAQGHVQGSQLSEGEDPIVSELYEIRLVLDSDAILPFANNIGFRYCCQKQLHLTSAAAYFRSLQFYQRQRSWMIDRIKSLLQSDRQSFDSCLATAKQELSQIEVLHPDIRHWCPAGVAALTNASSDGVPAIAFAHIDVADAASSLPIFGVELVGKRHAGPKSVYDLSVPNPKDPIYNSFVANGRIVHNCEGDWKLHGNHTGGYYKCNKWDPKEQQKKSADKGSAEEAKAELNRYLHYYQRYHNHDQSRRFAERQRIQTEKRMATLHAKSGGEAAWIDFQFLAAATQQVLECRHVLKYTYVFAYYLPAGPEKTLFEFLQQQLEAANEHLSELSELPPIDKLDRTQIVNYTRITNQFMNNLLAGVAAGLTPH